MLTDSGQGVGRHGGRPCRMLPTNLKLDWKAADQGHRHGPHLSYTLRLAVLAPTRWVVAVSPQACRLIGGCGVGWNRQSLLPKEHTLPTAGRGDTVGRAKPRPPGLVW